MMVAGTAVHPLDSAHPLTSCEGVNIKVYRLHHTIVYSCIAVMCECRNQENQN